MANSWFPHDSTAHNDQKILLLREEYGWEGYGLYWAVLEAMYETPDARLDTDVLRALYVRFGVEKQKLMKLIEFCVGAGLFVESEGTLYTERLISEKSKLLEKSEKARLAVSMRQDRRKRKKKVTDVQRSYNERSTKPPLPTLPNLTLQTSTNVDVLDVHESELRELMTVVNQILSPPKVVTKTTIDKFRARRKKYSLENLIHAFQNLQNEHDHWKIDNNGHRSMQWWLHSDQRIEDMLNCHLKKPMFQQKAIIIPKT